MKRILVGTAALVIVLYLGAIGYLRLNETDLVFPREVAPGVLPAPADSLELPFRSVDFRADDSVRLNAWVIPSRHDDSTGYWVLLCHGQTGNVATTTRPQYYAYLRDIGVNILAFDWRGFGASEGTPREEGLYRDATAAYDYLRTVERVPADRIIIFGHSLGTAPAIELATRVPAAGLVIEGAPSSVRGRAQEIYPLLPISIVAHSDFNSMRRVAKVTMPILVMHARADKKIPLAHGRALFAAAHAPKRFVELAGDHHDAFLADSAVYFGAYSTFVRELARRGAR
jgi:pimeloyl-ACP methyl ester carboxylesterase